ncbi:6-pyruvoyl trahydropterin synthase family protein [Commensalibacter nepenthis]|uniref:6-carboxy-5,6,7,8-tetrahydropterin synthase n=1 Tax=Commensalibacter nepenthis TaxID=3043872 RepID=A0ABT6Q8T0_9PROT|nr:6-carboxytetrahydropterin synthase [Commensalibacter sp. TBRC 10068]MDI2112653.1 6-carboxytetrahydropterin synthase [Commensalibacter sp. TBRC 10068]
MLELVFTRRFAMAHRLIHGSSEVCATPHGHNEEVKIYLKPMHPQSLDGKMNVVAPFHKAKGTWHRFIDNSVDHAFQLAENDPLVDWFVQNEPRRLSKLLITPGDPTTELLACLFMSKLNNFLSAEQSGLYCEQIEILETPTNTVRFTGNPLEFIPNIRPPEQCWWQRADMSISDLKS